jgi:acyl-coenzyme A thioesterase PaaI-like protein
MPRSEDASWSFFLGQQFTRRIMEGGKWVRRGYLSVDKEKSEEKIEIGSGDGQGGDLDQETTVGKASNALSTKEASILEDLEPEDEAVDLFDAFWNKVLSTRGTIPHFILLVSKQTKTEIEVGSGVEGYGQKNRKISEQDKGQNATKKDMGEPEPAPASIDEMLALVHLGPYLASHEGVSHGGMVSTLLDEVMGSLVVTRRQNAQVVGEVDDVSTMTARLEVDFVKPVRVPGVVIIRAWVEEEVGRKIWVRGEILSELDGVDEEDAGGDGTVAGEICARGKALFVKVMSRVGG